MTKRKKLELEFLFSSSISMLNGFLTTADGLRSWYCQDVAIDDHNNYHFSWEGEQEKAVVRNHENKSMVEFVWQNRPSPEQTTFHITKSPVTGDTVLQVSTYCDEDYLDEEEIYWNNLIDELKRATGG